MANCNMCNLFVYPNGLTDLSEILTQNVLGDGTSFE